MRHRRTCRRSRPPPASSASPCRRSRAQIHDATEIVQRASGMAASPTRPWARSPPRRSISMKWSASSAPSPARPICWRSTPRSRPHGPARPGADLRWSPPRSRRWRSRPQRPPRRSRRRSPRCSRRPGRRSTMSAPSRPSWRISTALRQRSPPPSASRTRRRAKSPGISARRRRARPASRKASPERRRRARDTNRSADLVLTTAKDLSLQAAELRLSVDRFLANVAA